jgi:PAS domain S-box-containing protein
MARLKKKTGKVSSPALATFPELNPNPVVGLDRKGNIEYLNPASVRAFPDLRRLKSRHPYLKGVKDIIDGLITDTAGRFDREIYVRGRWFYQWFCYAPGESLHVRLYGLDISSRKRYEEALRQSNSLLTSTFESITGGILVVSLHGRIVSFNRRFAQMWGIPAAVLSSADDRKALDYVLGQLKEPAEFIGKVKDLYRHPDQESHDVIEFKDGRVFDRYSRPQVKEGKIVGRVWSFLDITERRRSEIALRESEERFRGLAERFEREVRERTAELVAAQVELERAKRLSDIGLLASTVAHELRNPLAAINMACHNIEMKAKSPLIEKHLERIKQKIVESDQIINNLLFYSRLKPPYYERVKVCEMIEESIDSICGHVCSGVRVQRDLAALRDVSIDADPVQIKEVLSNLLHNACDAIGGKSTGVIVIAGRQKEGFVEISIKDNGQGIPKEVLARLFDPFFSTKARGTGLGLSVCKQIIHYHGGQIAIESEVGRGATVTISLPKVRKVVQPEQTQKNLEKGATA